VLVDLQGVKHSQNAPTWLGEQDPSTPQSASTRQLPPVTQLLASPLACDGRHSQG
jgi:hypothetical protein